MKDAKYDMKTASPWTVLVKNILQNHGGYSPNQSVVGTYVNLLPVITDLTQGLEPFTSLLDEIWMLYMTQGRSL